MTSVQVGPAPYRLVWDDFRAGFATAGSEARWAHQSAGPHVADDGAVTTSAAGLRVVAGGTRPGTGDPMFVRTVDPGGGLPGALDHVKWLAQGTHVASTGHRGFDAVPGQRLAFELRASGRTHGTHGHPFGDRVLDPDTDLRLAAAAVNCYDPQTLTIFAFFLSNRLIYAGYERLPFARPALGHYAAFCYAVPLAGRAPADWHDLAISYDRGAGVVRWLVDGSEAFAVSRLGRHLHSREHLVLDHGGAEAAVSPTQLNCGMGLFTLLDAGRPGTGAGGLVRLCADDGHYLDPARGARHPQRFLDERSRRGHRLFGQGAELSVAHITVSSTPIDARGAETNA